MEFQAFRCDECGVLKQDANHWWRMRRGASGQLALFPWATSDYEELRANDGGTMNAPRVSPLSEVIHLCGRECVLKAISKAMEEK